MSTTPKNIVASSGSTSFVYPVNGKGSNEREFLLYIAQNASDPRYTVVDVYNSELDELEAVAKEIKYKSGYVAVIVNASLRDLEKELSKLSVNVDKSIFAATSN